MTSKAIETGGDRGCDRGGYLRSVMRGGVKKNDEGGYARGGVSIDGNPREGNTKGRYQKVNGSRKGRRFLMLIFVLRFQIIE